MSLGESVYELAIRVARPALRVAGPFSAKLANGLEGRRNALPTLDHWARETLERDAGPTIWLHAPSAGEALMAQAILAALRNARPDVRCVFTYFSPSAERVVHRVGADVSIYLPWDTTEDMGRALAMVEPAAVVFVRTEIWPVLVRLAVGQGRPTLLVNAVLGERSSRLRAPGRRLLRRAYERIDAVGAIATEDAQRFPRLGVNPDRVHVTGDARFDQVYERVAALDRSLPLLRRFEADDRFTIVAGSTWPADEARLIPAFARTRAQSASRLIIAPHEPTIRHLEGIEKRLRNAGLQHARLGSVEAGTALPDVLVIDRVGVLADLYAIADVAWIGGGFGRAGLHSVIEPAALGVPVLCGPHHGNAREAGELVREGGGFIVMDGEDAAGRQLASLATDREACAQAGRVAATFVEQRRGGAIANAELIAEHLPG